MIDTITCPFCSLHCSGLHLEWDGDRLNTVSPACSKANKGFSRALTHATHPEGSPGIAEIITAIQPCIQGSQRLAVVLCSDLPQEAVPAALEFCQKHSAFLVTDDEFSGSILSLSVKETGILTASLGEIKSRVDQIICCGKDTLQILPRLEEFLPAITSWNIRFLPDGSPLTTLQNLRLETEDQAANPVLDSESKPGLVLFNRSWLQEDLHTAEEFLHWLVDLNHGKRWYGLYAPPGPNSPGICNALLSAAGSPGCMHVSTTGIEYNPRQFQLQQLINDGWIDTCIIAGSPDLLSASQKIDLEKVATVLLSPEPVDWQPDVYLPVARAGVDCAGTMQRLDYLPIRLQPLTTTSRVPVETVLHSLAGGAAA